MSEYDIAKEEAFYSKMSDRYYLGLDVGSISLKTVLVTDDKQILFEDYTRTKGQPFEKAVLVLGDLISRFDPSKIATVSVTGAGAKLMADLLGGNFVNEIIAQTRAAGEYVPNARTIIDMANHLVNWTVHEHPVPALHDALFEAYIEETPPGDPQPNPPDELTKIRIYPPTKRISSEREIALVVEFIKHWVSQEGHEQQTAAVLVPTNVHGDHVIAELKAAGLPFVELDRKSVV